MCASTLTLALLGLLAVSRLPAAAEGRQLQQSALEAAQLAAQVAQLQALIAGASQQQAWWATSDDQQVALRRQARAAARAARRARAAARRAAARARAQAQQQAQQQADNSGGSNDNGDDNSDGGSDGGGAFARNVYSTYHYYSPGYYTSSLYCADAFSPLLAAGRGADLLQRPWTAYCLGSDPMSQDKCGQCLQVTNPATGQSVQLTIVDLCGNGGLDIDPLGFNAIDRNGAGRRDGHMNLILEWC